MTTADIDEVPCTCFACTFTGNSPNAIFDHAASAHSLDVKKVLSSCEAPVDQLDYVKLINYLRKNGGKIVANEWKSDENLKPVLDNDPLLYFDVEEFGTEPVNCDDPQNTEITLRKKLEVSQLELEEARVTIAEMRSWVHKWVGDNGSSNAQAFVSKEEQFAANCDDPNADIDSEEEHEPKQNNRNKTNGHQANHNGNNHNNNHNHNNNNNNHRNNNSAMSKIAPVDSSYFCSYAGYSVHKDMLQDKARTMAYLDFVKKNRVLFEGKVVLDVGCGTGILSMFAVRYGGAKKVFALEPSNMAFQAIDTMKENGIAPDAITVINAPAESDEVARVMAGFAPEGVDIVISEWMGYFLLFENMLPSVIFARDKFMKSSGIMAPSRADLFLDATDNVSSHDEFVNYWSDVYGFTMSSMRRRILLDAQLYCYATSDICSTKPATVLAMDLQKCTPPPAHINVTFEMEFTRETKVTAFVGWFTVDFEGGPEKVTLSTAPGLYETHWKQTALFLPEPVPVVPNEKYKCNATVQRMENDHRSLGISVTFKEKTYRWALCRD